MKISIEALLLIIWPIGTALVVGGLWVNDGIIRHICRREGRRYSVLWVFNFYWHCRAFSLNWLKEAKEAGLLANYIIVTTFWIALILFLIGLDAGGYIYYSPPLH